MGTLQVEPQWEQVSEKWHGSDQAGEGVKEVLMHSSARALMGRMKKAAAGWRCTMKQEIQEVLRCAMTRGVKEGSGV